MEIKIRGISSLAISKIDELAKEKGQSRNEYLREHIESFSANQLHSDLITKYENQLEINSMLLEKMIASFDNLDNTLKELIDYD